MINPHIFREYDIRGTVGRDLTPEVVELLGRGIGTVLRRAGGRRAVLARYNRLSSPSFRDALAAGLMAAGVDVVDLGLVPTPLLYDGLHHFPCDGGVMITGSHNPPEFNGFKIAIGKSTVWGPRIQELRALIERREFESGELKATLRRQRCFSPRMQPYSSSSIVSMKSLSRPPQDSWPHFTSTWGTT